MRHKMFERERLGPDFEYNTRHGAKGLWKHRTSPERILNAIYTTGEICVTSLNSPIFGEDYKGDLAADEGQGKKYRGAVILYIGTPSYYFQSDCWSSRLPDGRRYATHHGSSSSHDEAWLVPAKSKCLAVYCRVGAMDEDDRYTLRRAGIEIYHSISCFEHKAHLPRPWLNWEDVFPGLALIRDTTLR